MKFLGASAVGLIVMLSSCGEGSRFSGDARASYDECRRNGGEPGYCECVTEALQSSMSVADFAAMAKGEPADLDETLSAISAADARCVKQPS